MSDKKSDSFIVPVGLPEPPEAPLTPPTTGTDERAPNGRPLAGTLKRHWILVLSTWLFMSGLGTVWVWTHYETEYQAVGIVRLSPLIPRLVFPTETNGIVPFYSAFLTTQMQLIANATVLRRATQAPELKSSPLLADKSDPVGFLAAQLKIDNPSNTELIAVALSGNNPLELAPVVNAVLRAYMEKVIEQDQTADIEKLELLYKKQTDLESELKTRNDELYKLANEHGTLSLDAQQDTVLAGVREIEIELKKTQASRVAAQARLKSFQQRGLVPVSALDLAQTKAEMMSQDSELVMLTYSRRLEESKLLQGAQQLGPDHRENRYSRERIAQLDQLIAKRQQAIAGPIESLAQYRAKLAYEGELRKAEQEVAEAAQREKAMQDVLHDDLVRAAETGRHAVQLQAVRDRVEQSKQLYKAVLDRIQNLEVEKQRPARVSVTSWATEPASPAADRRPKLTILAVVAGLFASVMLAVLVDARDTSVRCEEDIRRSVGLNILGTRSMPRRRKLDNQAVLAAIAEEIRGIRGCILFAGGNCELKSLLITSPNPREGKTRMSGDLAVALAESGRRVLLIDADNRKRDLSRQFGADDRPGLSELLSNGHAPEQVIFETATPGLWLLPSGSTSEEFSEWLVHPGRVERVREVFADYDVVVVDSPPVLLSNDAGVWTRHVDASLLVLRAGYSAREDAICAKEKLSRMGGNIIGAVLNGVHHRGMYYQRHGYYAKL